MSDSTEPKKTRTTVWIEEEMYIKLRQKLMASRLSFASWIDKHVRKELGMSPKFSYPPASAPDEE